MPSKTPKQKRTMRAAAHNPAFAAKVGIPVSVAKDFAAADKRAATGGIHFAWGGRARRYYEPVEAQPMGPAVVNERSGADIMAGGSSVYGRGVAPWAEMPPAMMPMAPRGMSPEEAQANARAGFLGGGQREEPAPYTTLPGILGPNYGGAPETDHTMPSFNEDGSPIDSGPYRGGVSGAVGSGRGFAPAPYSNGPQLEPPAGMIPITGGGSGAAGSGRGYVAGPNDPFVNDPAHATEAVSGPPVMGSRRGWRPGTRQQQAEVLQALEQYRQNPRMSRRGIRHFALGGYVNPLEPAEMSNQAKVLAGSPPAASAIKYSSTPTPTPKAVTGPPSTTPTTPLPFPVPTTTPAGQGTVAGEPFNPDGSRKTLTPEQAYANARAGFLGGSPQDFYTGPGTFASPGGTTPGTPAVNPLANNRPTYPVSPIPGDPTQPEVPVTTRTNILPKAAAAGLPVTPPPVVATPVPKAATAPPVVINPGPPVLRDPTVDDVPPPVLNEAPKIPVPGDVLSLDQSQDTHKYALPTGETVGYGGKLNYDVLDTYRKQMGREADPGGLDFWRGKLANGMSAEDLGKTFDTTQEGQDYNLGHDPLDDQMFARRLYKDILGREPDNAGIAQMLSQGYDRQTAIDSLLNSAEFKASGRKVDQKVIDAIKGQGDPFKYEFKNDATEKTVKDAFKTTMGRDPTDLELAKYAEAIRSGKLITNATTPEQNSKNFYYQLQQRKAAGWNKGGRIRPAGYGIPFARLKQHNGPEPEGGYADGGRVEEDKETKKTKKLEVKEGAEVKTDYKGLSTDPKIAVNVVRGSRGLRLPPFRGELRMADGGYVMNTDGTVRFDPQTGGAEYQDEKGNWTSFNMDNQNGPGSRRDARLFGTAGNISYPNDPSMRSFGNSENWKQYYDEQMMSGGDSTPDYSNWTLNEAAKKKLGNRVQIGQLGKGGYSEAKDASKVEWDDEFGYVTDQGNMGKSDPGGGLTPEQIGLIAVAIMTGGTALAAEGAIGAGAGVAAEGAIGAGAGLAAEGAIGAGAGLTSEGLIAGGAAAEGLGTGALGSLGEGAIAAIEGSEMIGNAIDPGYTPFEEGFPAPEGGGLPDTALPDGPGPSGAPEGPGPSGEPAPPQNGAPPGTPDSAPPPSSGTPGTPTTPPSTFPGSQTDWLKLVQKYGLTAARLLASIASSRSAPKPGQGMPTNPYQTTGGGGGAGMGTRSSAEGLYYGDNPNPVRYAPPQENLARQYRDANPPPPPQHFAQGGEVHAADGMDLADWYSRMTGIADKNDPLLLEMATKARNWNSPQRREEYATMAREGVLAPAEAYARSLRGRPGVDQNRAEALIAQNQPGTYGNVAMAENRARMGLDESEWSKFSDVEKFNQMQAERNAKIAETGAGYATSRANTQDNNATSLANNANSNATQYNIAGMGDRRARDFQNEDTRRWDLGYGENNRRYDTNFGEDQRRYDTSRGDTLQDRAARYGLDYARLQAGLDSDNRNNQTRRNNSIGQGIYYGSQLPWGDMYRGGRDFFDSRPTAQEWVDKHPGDPGDEWDAGGNFNWDFGANKGGRADFQHGGDVEGPGDGTKDTVPAMLANGEVVINAEGAQIADQMHPGLLDGLNAKGMQMRQMIAKRGLRTGGRGRPSFGAMGV